MSAPASPTAASSSAPASAPSGDSPAGAIDLTDAAAPSASSTSAGRKRGPAKKAPAAPRKRRAAGGNQKNMNNNNNNDGDDAAGGDDPQPTLDAVEPADPAAAEALGRRMRGRREFDDKALRAQARYACLVCRRTALSVAEPNDTVPALALCVFDKADSIMCHLCRAGHALCVGVSIAVSSKLIRYRLLTAPARCRHVRRRRRSPSRY